MKKLYKIAVHGCDDSTYIDMELTDKQAELVGEVAVKISEASTYGCMPTMQIELKARQE